MNINKKWVLNDSFEHAEISSIIKSVLTSRGIEEDSLEDFLNPKLSNLTLESVGINLDEVKKAIKRIKKAIDLKEQIIIYGDYDVDGITGAAILWESLYELGANVLPYIPHRVDEGYGLSEKGLENLLATTPPRLIITVDNGIVANASVDMAREQGIDVIVTDHHVLDSNHPVPAALALIHTTMLCGSSVALLFSKEIKNVLQNEKTEFDPEHIILASLATIADLVPLTAQSRTIVKRGLELFSSTKRHGLRELVQISGIESKHIGVYEVGHIIAPRINAAGRIESGMDSLRLLCTKNRSKAHELAFSLDQINKRRQTLMKNSAISAIAQVNMGQNDKKILIVEDSSFEEGIIGLVAGKLVEEFYKPSIAIAVREGVSKGSVRSVSGVNIIELLRSVSDLFINVGGHPMAAGFSIKTEDIEMLKNKLEKVAEKAISEQSLLKSIKIDCQISLAFPLNELYAQIKSLGPFGMGNPEPCFLSRKVYVRDKRIIGKEGTHVRLVLSQDEISTPYEAIAFGMAEAAADIEKDDLIDIVYTMDINTWNDITKLQMKLKDFKKIYSSAE